MCEIIWYGRGGGGAFTAARLLGIAASLENRYALVSNLKRYSKETMVH